MTFKNDFNCLRLNEINLFFYLKIVEYYEVLIHHIGNCLFGVFVTESLNSHKVYFKALCNIKDFVRLCLIGLPLKLL